MTLSEKRSVHERRVHEHWLMAKSDLIETMEQTYTYKGKFKVWVCLKKKDWRFYSLSNLECRLDSRWIRNTDKRGNRVGNFNKHMIEGLLVVG